MMAIQQEKASVLMREVLADSYTKLEVSEFVLEEDLVAGYSTVRANLMDASCGRSWEIRGTGVGLVDAFYGALVEKLSGEYRSLDHILFRTFSIEGETDTGMSISRSDAVATVRLEVDNQVGRTFAFTASTRSVSASCIRATLAAVEYFVNSERAFFRVRGFLHEAQAKARADLVEQYTHMLSQLVMNTSYSNSTDD